MASLVLGTIGAFIGAPFGMGGLGFMIGSSLGSWLTAPDQYGPRLGEVKVQSSSFGTPLPIPYGVPPPFAGTVIWEDQIKEHSNTESAGKGGPQITTYTYTQSYAIAICEGPIAAIVRVWKNGKLIYNVGSGADAATLSKLPANLKLYLGTPTQSPDPTLEAVLGVGNVSAYRGTVYAVLTDDDVTANGGIAWQYKFEVATAGSQATALTWDSYENIKSYERQSGTHIWEGENMWASCADSTGMHVFNIGLETSSDVPVLLEHWVVPYSGAPYRLKRRAPVAYQEFTYASWTQSDVPGLGLYVHDLNDGLKYMAWLDGNLGVNYIVPIAGVDGVMAMGRIRGTTLALVHTYLAGIFYFQLYLNGDRIPMEANTDQSNTIGKIWISENYFWLVYRDRIAAQDKINRYDLLGNHVDTTIIPSGLGLEAFIGVFDDDRIILPSGNDVYRYSISGASYESFPWLSAWNDAHGSQQSMQSGYVSIDYNPSVFHSDFAAISWTSFLYPPNASPQYGVAHRWTRHFAPDDVTLAEVQSDICTRCGLTTGEIDVADLTDVVNGYAVMGRMSGRAASEPLLSAYFYDAGEWDGKLNFIKRGAASGGTIPLDDLSAHSFGDQPPDPVTKTRNDRAMLPTQVDVEYYNPANDNQAGLQSERRFTINNDNPITLSFSTLVLEDAHAKGIAQVNLFNFWANANPMRFATGPKWQHLTPTDVHDIESHGTVRITNKHEAVNGVVQFEAVTEQPSIYGQTAVGAGGTQTGQTSVAYPGPTRLELLDIPILQDGDDDYGFYAGVDGFLTGWKGATVFKSIDGGSTYTPILTDSDAGVMGYTSTALPDWTRGNVLDTQSVVRVELDAGDTLSSITWTQMLQNGNPCLIGSEICQFMTATLVSTGIYDLSGFLRGRKGTEWACTGHASGERFVMLDASTIKRIGAPPSDIALSLAYKGVTAGLSVASAEEQDFTNTGVGKKPYAPALLGYYAATDGSWWITWQRRSRIDNQWHAYANEPLGETTEAYEVDIYDSTGTTFKRTYSVTSQTVHYLLADVTSDGTSTHFVAKVYQIGALGRGYAGTLTV